MPTARALVADATNRLTKAGVPSPSVDAAELLAFVLGTTRTRLLLHDDVDPDAARTFERLLTKRMSRVPLQHLTGLAAFRYLDLEVGPGVFIPRPETELAVEIVVRDLRERGAGIAVDLCSGSGAIALAVGTEVPGARVHAVELSPHALVWLHRNAQRHAAALAAVGSRVDVHAADATAAADGALASVRGSVDVVVSNPPYIPEAMVPIDPEVALHDPRLALYGGTDGLDVVRGLVPVAHALLRPGGLLVLEHADAQGEEAGERGVPGLLRALGGWTEVVDHVDLAGRPRVTTARAAG